MHNTFNMFVIHTYSVDNY